MHWLYTTFKTHCERQGLTLMKEDIKFIERALKEIPSNIHKSIMNDYCKEWCKGIADEPNASKKQNFGRNKANLFLLSKLDW